MEKTCSRVMLEEQDRRVYLKRLRAPGLDNMQRAKIVKAVHEKCKKVTYCPYCNAVNGKNTVTNQQNNMFLIYISLRRCQEGRTDENHARQISLKESG